MRQESDLWAVNHVSVSIDRPPADVYAFVSDPANVPAWATGLAGTITRVGENWIADSPLGKVKVRFADKNAFGVLDHDVTLPSGVTLRNPMRVMPNDRGSEVVFTLFRRPGVSEAKFADDATWVARDLRALKAVLEGRR